MSLFSMNIFLIFLLKVLKYYFIAIAI